MAVLDTETDEIVLRIVYDGPPEAGKTTSLRALGSSLAQELATPAEDETGRTLWFDWLEYVGGRFEGSRIRCQIVSVPGQRTLGRRRRLLLDSADVIVFVADSTDPETSLAYLQEVPAVGVVFQANKRDLPEAVAMEELRERVGPAIGVVESVAADGTGIREAFVYAVRLALDRVREQMQRGTLTVGRPALATPGELLEVLRGEESRDSVVSARMLMPRVISDGLGAELFLGVLDDEAQVESRIGGPSAPDASVPSGAIWPPVEGRAILAEVSALGLVPRALRDGAWIAGLGTGWRVVSARDAVHETLDVGRAALIQWARLHVACTGVMSARRCIVLAATGDGRWRLWQIVRAEESLRAFVEGAAAEVPEVCVQRLCTTGRLLLDVGTRAPFALPTSLDTVGAEGAYIGLMPETPAPRGSVDDLLDRELGPLVAQQLHRREVLWRMLARVGPSDAVVASLSRMFTSA